MSLNRAQLAALAAQRKVWMARYKHRRAVAIALRKGEGKHTIPQRIALINRYRAAAHAANAAVLAIDAQTHPDREAELRNKILGWAMWGVHNNAQIHYSQGSSRMAAIGHPGTLPLWTDCSGSSTLYYNWAGAPDPNGLGYNHLGNTQTMYASMSHIDDAAGKPADLIIYNPRGPLGTQHVVVITKNLGGGQYVVASHGQEAGPFLISHAAELAAHGNNGFSVCTLHNWR